MEIRNSKITAREILAFYSLFDCELALGSLFMLSGDSVDILDLEEKLKNLNVQGDLNYDTVNKSVVFGAGLYNKKVADNLWKKVIKYLRILSVFPFLKMVAVGNTLAMGVTDDESDIDLFIVTKKNRLFISRILVTGYFQILGLRRHGKQKQGRFCLSFWVDEDSLDISAFAKGERDFYLFMWISTLRPIFGLRTYLDFLEANRSFLSKFVEQFRSWNTDKLLQELNCLRLIKVFWEFVLNVLVAWWLEPLMKFWQIKRALSKKAHYQVDPEDLVINKKVLKFHLEDKRQYWNQKWLTELNKNKFL